MQPPPASESTYALPSATYPSGFAPPPDVINGVRNMTDDAANALRRELENGIQQANQQLSRSGGALIDNARSVGGGLSAQAQEFTNNAVRSLDPAGDPFRNPADDSLRMAQGNRPSATATPGGVSAPPWQTAAPGGSSSTYTGNVGANGWSSSNSTPGGSGATVAPPFSGGSPGMVGRTNSVPEQSLLSGNQNWSVLGNNSPPPLLTPSLAPPPGSGTSGPGQLGATSSMSAPAFAAAPANLNPPSLTAPNFVQGPSFQDARPGSPLHDSLYDPGLPGAVAAQAGNRPDTQGQLQPPSNSPAVSDRFNTPPVSGGPASANSGLGSSAPPSFGGAVGGQTGILPPPSNPQAGIPPRGNDAALPSIGNNLATQRTPAAQSPPRSPSDAGKPTAEEGQKPWIPFLLTLLGLIGSISANFFLGWSYMDARQKYQSLVRKTAGKLRRAAEAA
jgi:hypothetical protein